MIGKSSSIVKCTCLAEDISIAQTDCVEFYKQKHITRGPDGGTNWSVMDYIT